MWPSSLVLSLCVSAIFRILKAIFTYGCTRSTCRCFFFISGVFFSPEKFAVVKSAVQLLVPFVLFNLIALLISFFIGSIFSGTFKLSILHWDAVLHGSYPVGPSWFLLSLCIIRFFTGLLLKWFDNFVLNWFVSVCNALVFIYSGCQKLVGVEHRLFCARLAFLSGRVLYEECRG